MNMVKDESWFFIAFYDCFTNFQVLHPLVKVVLIVCAIKKKALLDSKIC